MRGMDLNLKDIFDKVDGLSTDTKTELGVTAGMIPDGIAEKIADANIKKLVEIFILATIPNYH